MKRILLFVLISFVIASPILGQTEIGKIFSNEEATKLFGQVTLEKEIPISVINNALVSCKNRILFNFVNNELYVSTDKSKLIFTSSSLFSQVPLVNYTFTKGVVEKFLATNPNALSIKVQMRNTVLTLSNGSTILELSLQCPPYCGDY